ncbi:MAG: hypothetical protein JO197_00330 [Acidobacteria bacterium]|nr:hypothetical protein [Acidobacteriota bacterium]MBV9474688.1 hypothetical protein [Acidobacteriota bacterium]
MPIRWGYLKRVLAGAIFGLYMTHLLYFLNPQVEITPGRLVLVTIVYGLTCGLLFGTLLWGLRALRVRLFGKPEAWRTHGFGFVVLAAFLSAGIYWMHLKLLGIQLYLPIGAVRILSKATVAITATAFVLLALWVVERNADRQTSRVLFVAGVVLIALSSVFLYQRRESYRTERKNVVVATIGAVGERRPVIVIAIRNLPFDWIVTMRGEGLLPFFDAAGDRAFLTRLEPFPTRTPKSLWASLATGKLPYRHGVTGRFAYRTPLNRAEPFLLLPYGVGFQAWGLIPPVERISAPLPAGNALPLWTLFERVQLPASVIGWPSSTQTSSQPRGATRIVTDDALRALPVDARALGNISERFNSSGDAKPAILAALARDAYAAAQLRDARPYALRVLALEGFADAQRALHIFTNELPPKTSAKGEALRAYAQQLDRLLGGIVREHPDALVVVCSPSAVVAPQLPANVYSIARSLLSPDDPGADDGFFLAVGPGGAHRENPQPAFAVDLVPTVLFAAGLPIGRDMDGRIVTDAFTDDALRATTLIQTYEAERFVVRRAGG